MAMLLLWLLPSVQCAVSRRYHVPRCTVFKLVTGVLAAIYEVLKDQIKYHNYI